MKNKLISTILFSSILTTSSMAIGENIQERTIDFLEQSTPEDNTQADTRGANNIRSVRQVMGGYDPLEHSKMQLRMGYISLDEDGSEVQNGYAIGGHIHLDSKRWNGLMLGGSIYTVLNLGINQNSLYTNPDFFDAEKDSFILLPELFISGKWKNTELKAGRQSLDTPHADSDDIRMMPNYFMAYTVRNDAIDGLILFAGLIKQMAGWENGVDSSDFVDITEALGLVESHDGVYYASAVYEGIEDLSLSLWYYDFDQIANVWFAEAVYSYDISNEATFSMGLQYDKASHSGQSLVGDQDSNTFGISAEVAFENLGLTILTAYNKDNGDTGASGLSLGGGPFFTSMEDQTLDAIEHAGSAWMLGAGYDLAKLGIDDLVFGLAYGHFEAEDASLYESREIDIILEYSPNDKFSITAAFAGVDHQDNDESDYNQFRVIANYNF